MKVFCLAVNGNYPQNTAACLLVSDQLLQRAVQIKVLHYKHPVNSCAVIRAVAAEYARYQQLRDMPVHTNRSLVMLETLIHRSLPVSMLSQLDASQK